MQYSRNKAGKNGKQEKRRCRFCEEHNLTITVKYPTPYPDEKDFANSVNMLNWEYDEVCITCIMNMWALAREIEKEAIEKYMQEQKEIHERD